MRRSLLAVLVCLLFASGAFAQPPVPALSTPAREATWAQMKADYDASPSNPATYGGKLYARLKSCADAGTCYSDHGQYGAWMYHVTGDAAYVAKAWTQISTTTSNAGSGFLQRSTVCSNAGLAGNWSREYFVRFGIMYSWLYPGLTAQQRSDFEAQMNNMANCVGAGWAYRAEDSDQTTGDYFGFVLWYALTKDWNSTIVTYWGQSSRAVGGYDATAEDGTTFRNALKKYVNTFGAGGEWPEANEYNTGTIRLLGIGYEALKTVVGTDHFPEVAAWLPDAAIQYQHNLSPGISELTSQPYGWGDTQRPRDKMTYNRFDEGMMLAGLLDGETGGPEIQDLVLDWADTSTFAALNPFGYGYFIWNPYATRGDHTTVSTTHYASGTGHYRARSGWANGDWWFGAHFPTVLSFGTTKGQVDHVQTYWGEFQLWRDGKWAITHPLGYQSPAYDSRGTGGMSFSGLPAFVYGPSEYKAVVAQRRETSPLNYVYTAGTQGGSMFREYYYGMPPNHLMEHTRSLVWLPDSGVLVVHDRANAKAMDVSSLNASSIKTWIQSRTAWKELYIHTSVSPTEASGYSDWAYSGSNHVRVSHLLPADYTTTIENETTLWVAGYYGSGTAQASEKKYHVLLAPGTNRQWDTFLNVWDVYDTGTPKAMTLVQDTSGKVDAVLVPGTPNVLVAFNAAQGPDLAERTITAGYGYWGAGNATTLATVHLRSTSYSLTWNSGAVATTVLLADLDPNTSWEYQINGGAQTALTVSADGTAIVQTGTTGVTTLDVLAGGDFPVTIVDASLPAGRKGTAYSHQMTSAGGAGSPAWSKTVGTWQTGLGISAGGLISGTPTTAGDQAITLQACDPSPTNCGTREYTMTVADVPDITTTGLANCALGSAYSQTLAATGGTAPYTFSVQSGTLPTGLSLAGATGAITGTCTGALGTSELTFRVTDNAAGTGDQALGITVVSALPALTAKVQSAGTSAVVTYGITGLSYNDSCTVNLLDGESVQATATQATGAARRVVTFTGLTPDATYGVDVTCGTAVTQQRSYFTTKAPTGGPTTFSFKAKAPAWVKTAATAQNGNTAALGLVVCFDAACSSTYSCKLLSSCPGDVCSVSRSLSAGVHYVWHRWSWLPFGAEVCAETTTYATTAHRKGLVAIP